MGENKVLLEGLLKAKDDQKMLNDTSFNKNFGPCLYNKYYEHLPMFFNRFGAEIDLIGQYHGASIFLICNGPSIVSGDYDLNKLKYPGIVTYGINNGPRTIRPNMWTCVDSPERFLKSVWLDPVITKIVPFTFSEKPIFDNEKWETSKIKVQDCPNIIYFRRNEKFVANRFLKELTVNWGNHKDYGGGRSVMLAALKIIFLLGFRNVFLMGADFTMSESYTYHFDEQRATGAVKGNLDTYHKLMTIYFPQLKPHFEEEGFYVYNCNPNSELKVFDYVPFDDAIAFAMKNLGDVVNERTWGMYSKPEERQKWKNEPDDKCKVHLANIANRPQIPVVEKINIAKPNNIKNNVKNIEDNGEMPIDEEMEMQELKNRTKMSQIAQSRTQQKPNKERQIVDMPKSIPMKEKIPVLQTSNPNNIKPQIVQKDQQVKIVDFQKQQLQRKQEQEEKMDVPRIVRSVPCGGGVSFGSSGASKHNITITKNVTIPDNGR